MSLILLYLWLWAIPVCFIFTAVMLFRLDRTLRTQYRQNPEETE